MSRNFGAIPNSEAGWPDGAPSAGGDMLKADNLSGLANTTTARSNLGLGGAATLAVGTTAGTVAAGDDSRLSDSRTPLTHSHAASDVTGTAVVTNDARLSDTRTPTDASVTLAKAAAAFLAYVGNRVALRC